MATTPSSPADVSAALSAFGYIPDDGLSTSVFLAMSLQRPLLLEGEAGVGKTEVAKVLSRWTGGELIRLQCYEGIDVSQAVYDWDYSRQLLHLRASEATGESLGLTTSALEQQLYNERFLLKRALLQAIDHRNELPPVLLIDEVDRADDEFEAYLLEVLSEYAVTVPELGRFAAIRPPLVILTSNRTRDVHDALKRRCLYHWVEHPDLEREVAIVRARVPQAGEQLARQVAASPRPSVASSCTSPRAWPRPSTGPWPSLPSGGAASIRPRWPPPSARSSSTARTPIGCAVTASTSSSTPPAPGPGRWRPHARGRDARPSGRGSGA